MHALVAARVLLPPSAASAPPPAPAPRAPEPDDDAPMPPPPVDDEAKRERARKRRRERAAAAKAERERAAAPASPPPPAVAAPPPAPAVVTIDDDDDMAPGDDDDGVAPAPAAPTHDSEIAAWAALAPRGVREAWEKADLDFGQQLREAFSGSSDATELDVPAALKHAGELETVALGLRFFAAARRRRAHHRQGPAGVPARRRALRPGQLLQRVHEREFAGPGLGVAHVDERVRLPDLVGDARVVGARRPRTYRLSLIHI